MEQPKKISFEMPESEMLPVLLKLTARMLAENRAQIELNCQILANLEKRDFKELVDKAFNKALEYESDILKAVCKQHGGVSYDEQSSASASSTKI